MTRRTLPPKADIHHLRKEAKKLYGRLKRQAPQASLADAQFILAAEYGFRSWGRLKTAVDHQAAERWAARLAAQEAFRPFPAPARTAPPRSLQHVWLDQQLHLTDDDEEQPIPLEMVWLHIGFILLALLFGLGILVR